MILKSFCLGIVLAFSIVGFQLAKADTIRVTPRITPKGEFSEVVISGYHGGVSEEFYRLFSSNLWHERFSVNQSYDTVRNDELLGLRESYLGLGFLVSFTQYEREESQTQKEIPSYLPPNLIEFMNKVYHLRFFCSKGNWKIEQNMDEKGSIHTQLFFVGILADRLHSYMENFFVMENRLGKSSEIQSKKGNKKYSTPNQLIQCEIKNYGLFRECRLTVQ